MIDKLLRNVVPLIIGLGLFVILTFLFILVFTGRDVENYVGSLSTLIGVFVSSGLLAALQTRTAKNVNGNQSALIAELRATREMAGITTGTVQTVTERQGDEYAPPIMGEDTINRIERDKDGLPSHKA